MATTNTKQVHYSRVDILANSRDATIWPKSWRAPLVIVPALVVGLAIALAHHFTYASLDGKYLDQVALSQAWILRFGTALAFLVKTSLVMSVGAAFVQHQWLRLRRQTFKLEEVDTITSILGNALAFFDITVWLRHPILVTLALISWTLPLTAIVTPGALTVASTAKTNTTDLYVPQPAFDTVTVFGGLGSNGPLPGVFMPSPKIHKLAFAAASSSQPLSLPWFLQNASYTIDFHGPAVKCSPANESLTRQATLAFGTCSQNAGDAVAFAAWAGGDWKSIVNLNRTSPQSLQPLDQTSTDGARIFVMTNIGQRSVQEGTTGIRFGCQGPLMRVNVTECMLYNASYTVDFNLQYPNQTQKISISEWLYPVAPLQLRSLTPRGGPILQYSLMMTAFGELLVGKVQFSHAGDDFVSQTNWDIIDIDWTSSDAVQDGLEQLFQNFTLSILSDPSMTKNRSLAGTVPVRTSSWENIYVYNSSDLLIAYGVGILGTALCAIVGLRAFVVNDASFQNVFSTYLRATTTATTGVEGDRDDVSVSTMATRQIITAAGDSGADPLPKGLRRTRVDLRAREVRRKREGEEVGMI